MKDGDAARPLELDALFWMGSCTKLMTVIAALQCVEGGHFTLDEDVCRLLPELKDIEVKTLAKDESGTPIRVKANKTITLRYVLTCNYR